MNFSKFYDQKPGKQRFKDNGCLVSDKKNADAINLSKEEILAALEHMPPQSLIQIATRALEILARSTPDCE